MVVANVLHNYECSSIDYVMHLSSTVRSVRCALQKLIRMNMPIADDGTVHFTTILFALIRESLRIKMGPPEEMDHKDDEFRRTLVRMWPSQAKKMMHLLIPFDHEVRVPSRTCACTVQCMCAAHPSNHRSHGHPAAIARPAHSREDLRVHHSGRELEGEQVAAAAAGARGDGGAEARVGGTLVRRGDGRGGG